MLSTILDYDYYFLMVSSDILYHVAGMAVGHLQR